MKKIFIFGIALLFSFAYIKSSDLSDDVLDIHNKWRDMATTYKTLKNLQLELQQVKDLQAFMVECGPLFKESQKAGPLVRTFFVRPNASKIRDLYAKYVASQHATMLIEVSVPLLEKVEKLQGELANKNQRSFRQGALVGAGSAVALVGLLGFIKWART